MTLKFIVTSTITTFKLFRKVLMIRENSDAYKTAGSLSFLDLKLDKNFKPHSKRRIILTSLKSALKQPEKCLIGFTLGSIIALFRSFESCVKTALLPFLPEDRISGFIVNCNYQPVEQLFELCEIFNMRKGCLFCRINATTVWQKMGDMKFNASFVFKFSSESYKMLLNASLICIMHSCRICNF